jgi:predicted DNA-binding transcriptional regulator
MGKDQALGALIFLVCAVLIVGYVGLLFLYDPYIIQWLNLGAATDIRYWLVAVPVLAAFVAILLIGAWIGWTIATTLPPKSIEEIDSEARKESVGTTA